MNHSDGNSQRRIFQDAVISLFPCVLQSVFEVSLCPVCAKSQSCYVTRFALSSGAEICLKITRTARFFLFFELQAFCGDDFQRTFLTDLRPFLALDFLLKKCLTHIIVCSF